MNKNVCYRVKALLIAFTLTTGIALASGIPRDGRTSEGSVFRSGSPMIMDIDGGVMLGGNALPGVDVQFTSRLNTSARLYAGVEVGFFFSSGTGSTAAIIPILASLSTEFDLSTTVHPMLGISLGPTLSTGGGFSTARFTALFNPGVRFEIGGSTELNAQVRFGAVGSVFVVLPQLGVSFAI